MNKAKKEFFERLLELIKEDPALHDATVRLLDSMANDTNASAEYKRARIKKGEKL